MLNMRDKSTTKECVYDFEIALAGNPNVGKSSLFNLLTGLKQHTGNWSGKTVNNAFGYLKHKGKNLKLVDLPGAYSLNPISDEEIIAKDYIVNKKSDCIIMVVDSTNLERNLNLVLQILKLTHKCILCLNMWDEAQKKGIYIDSEEVSLQLGIPVVKVSAKENIGVSELIDKAVDVITGKIKTFRVNSINNLNDNEYCEYIETIYNISTKICDKCQYKPLQAKHSDRYIDKLLSSKITGIPIMLLMLGVVFWITIVGANYISGLLSSFFNLTIDTVHLWFNGIGINDMFSSFIIDGVLTTLLWVVAVMLPPMAIFFPIFSLLEDFGVLPRIAFNLDSCFKSVGSQGKQALTMAMGLGCNSCGVIGCRIIGSQHEKNIAIATNSLIPCNGKLPTLIAVVSVFLATTDSGILNSIIIALVLVVLIMISIAVTMAASYFLSATIYKGKSSAFVMELPSYRKPKIIETILYSFKDKTIFVLLRAVTVAIPAGALIWLMANISLNGITILDYCSEFLNPLGQLLGLDGIILMAFILGFTANETVIPIMLMSYTSSFGLVDYSGLTELSTLLVGNGWTVITAICFLLLCLFHFPCSTTCITIYKETKNLKLTMISILLPTIIGMCLCMAVSFVFSH